MGKANNYSYEETKYVHYTLGQTFHETVVCTTKLSFTVGHSHVDCSNPEILPRNRSVSSWKHKHQRTDHTVGNDIPCVCERLCVQSRVSKSLNDDSDALPACYPMYTVRRS